MNFYGIRNYSAEYLEALDESFALLQKVKRKVK